MGTIIKLVIGLLVITGAFSAGRTFLNNYQFEDAVQQGMLFDPRADDAEVKAMVMKLANDYEIPLTVEGIGIRTQGQSVVVTLTYTDTVVVIPGIYSTTWDFAPSISTRILTGSRR
jgi:hypothetical protein